MRLHAEPGCEEPGTPFDFAQRSRGRLLSRFYEGNIRRERWGEKKSKRFPGMKPTHKKSKDALRFARRLGAKARSLNGSGRHGGSRALPIPFVIWQKVLLETFDCGGLVVLHIEDGVELGDLEEVMHLLGEVKEFEFAALVLGCGKGAD